MVEVLRTHEREAPLANDLLGGVGAVKFKTNFARETLKAVNSRVVSPLDKIAFANKLGASLFGRGSWDRLIDIFQGATRSEIGDV